MDYEIYSTAQSAVYQGENSWVRPAIFHARGTAGTMGRYLYGYILETCDSGKWSYEYDLEDAVSFRESALPEWEEELRS